MSKKCSTWMDGSLSVWMVVISKGVCKDHCKELKAKV